MNVFSSYLAQTGDTLPIWLFVILAVVAAIIAVMAGVIYHRANKIKKDDTSLGKHGRK